MSECADLEPRNFLWQVDGSVATIRLARPERKNPLTFESYAELRDTFRELDTEPGVRAVEEGGADKSGGDFVVPSGIMSRAMYLTLKAGGAPAVPQASPAKSELTPDESPQKNKPTRGTQHLDELLRKLGVEWDERPSSAPALRRH